MSDTFITIMIILISAILVFMVPVVAIAKRNDMTATQDVQATVTEFVDKTRTTGLIKKADYDNLIEELDTTGNVYDVQVSIQYLDENPAKKTSSNVLDEVKIGENVYYIEYTTQIDEAFKKNNNETIKLKAGDYVKIDVQNTNETLYQNFKRTLYNLSGGRIGTISGVHVGLVIDTTEGQQVGGNGVTETYTITYNANGGSGAPSSQTKNKGESLTLSSLIPTHSNSELGFAGWSEERNASEAMYPSGGIFTKDKNTTLYAVWKKKTHTIIYMPNLSKIVNELPAQDSNLKIGQSYTIWNGRTTPSVAGYKFKYWCVSKNGEGTRYNSGDTITITGSKVLYAIWEAEQFTLKFDKNAGSASVANMPGSMVCRYYEEFTLPSNTPTRNNYKFLGWSTKSDGEVEFKPGEKCTLEAYNNTLYAIWGEKHIVTYNANTRVLVVGYNNNSWVTSSVNYLKNIKELTVDGMTLGTDELDKVVEKKDDYDLIVINASAWSINTVDKNGRSKLLSIASSTHLITFGNDEKSVPFIKNTNILSNITMEIAATEKGNELVGVDIANQNDTTLYSATFDSDVTVLYTATYKDSNGEIKDTGDAIGVGQYVKGNNWVHGQISSVSNELLYKLINVAINGLEKTDKVVTNMPGEEIRGYKEKFDLPSVTPKRNNATFMGWSETPNGEVIHGAGTEFTMPNEDKTLYAIWGSNVEYYANTKVLIAEYNVNNAAWSESVVKYFNETGQFTADRMVISGGELEKIVDKKDDYDLIIINASAWSPSSISNNGRQKLMSIAEATHLITLGNDETNIPLIQKGYRLQEVNMYLTPTGKGRELIGESINQQSDSDLTVITFKSNVSLLYAATYTDRKNSDNIITTGDAIGFCEYTKKTNWIHGQIISVSPSALYKLSKVAINGVNNVAEAVSNMPQSEVHKHNSIFNISNNIPTRKGSTFVGWAETPNGEVKYTAGEQITMSRGHKKLYAVWK